MTPVPPTHDVVRIEWTTPPFSVIFGTVWKTGLAILLVYGLLFAVAGTLLAATLAGLGQ